MHHGRNQLKTLFTLTASLGLTLGIQAGVVTFSGTQADLNGTGFGNVLNVLTVHNRGSEFGSVLWNGSSDVLGGHATNTSQTQTASVMQANGIGGTKFAVYFNGNEPGNASSVLLHDFSVHFFAADGSSLFDAVYSAPVGGLGISDFGGTGQAGWLFEVALSALESSLFYGNGSNRIGMSIGANQAIELTAGGAENFFLGKLDPGPRDGGDPTPEPASMLVWGLVALGAVIGRSLRCRSQPAA